MNLKFANDPIKDTVEWNGVPVNIEWPAGSVREYTDDDTGAVSFSRNMTSDYGYVRNTTSSDGEEVDIYLGDSPNSERVFLIEQLVTSDYQENPEQEPGDFDELKFMLNYTDQRSAQKAYQDCMSEEHFGSITELSKAQFLKFLEEVCTS